MMKLYSYFRSSSAWRVRIALAYKNIAFEQAFVRLSRGEQNQADFMQLSPLSQVPVLEVMQGGQRQLITQSIAILEYLEETHPAPHMLPGDAVLRARVRELAELVNSGIQPLQNLKTQEELQAHGVDATPVARTFIARGLRALEQLAQSRAGRFLVGDEITFADACLIPQLAAARRYGVDVEPFALLRRVEQECEPLPYFRAARPEAQADFVKSPG
jgi:maleylpyruvate isomerase